MLQLGPCDNVHQDLRIRRVQGQNITDHLTACFLSPLWPSENENYFYANGFTLRRCGLPRGACLPLAAWCCAWPEAGWALMEQYVQCSFQGQKSNGEGSGGSAGRGGTRWGRSCWSFGKGRVRGTIWGGHLLISSDPGVPALPRHRWESQPSVAGAQRVHWDSEGKQE